MSEESPVTAGDLRALFAEFKLDLFREFEKFTTRKDHDALGARVTGIELWRAGIEAVSGWKKWQVGVALAAAGIAAGLIGSIATFYWLHHG